QATYYAQVGVLSKEQQAKLADVVGAPFRGTVVAAKGGKGKADVPPAKQGGNFGPGDKGLPGKKGPGGKGGMFGDRLETLRATLLLYLRDKGLQDELNLSAEQVKKVSEYEAKWGEAWRGKL